VVFASQSLSDRPRLERELDAVDADVCVVELKAAAIDVVAEHAAARGLDVVLAANDVVAPGLDEALLELAEVAAGAVARENVGR
jgi:cyclic 2,3-diphosphoglycerate synthetase